MYNDLRDWLVAVDKLGQVKRVNGAHWDVEMGALMQLVAERYTDKAPARSSPRR